MKVYYVYIVLCSDESYYTGMTNDIDRRMNEHNLGKKRQSYTYDKRPVELKWILICENPTEAIKIEKQIKGWSHRKKKALIDEKWDDLIAFSKNYTDFGSSSSTGSD